MGLEKPKAAEVKGPNGQVWETGMYFSLRFVIFN